MKNNRKILIIGAAWVGDMVMAQTLFKLLKQRTPECQIDVLAPAWTKPLLNRMPEVQESLDSPFDHGEFRLMDRYRLGLTLRERRYDQAIVLPNSYKSALVPWFAKVPWRTGWMREMRYALLNDVRYLNKKQLPLMIQRFIALGLEKGESLPDELPHPELQISESNVNTTLHRFSLSADTPILSLCPGAEFGPSKQWPVSYFAEVANVKLAEGWQVWLFGSAKDKSVTDSIVSLVSRPIENLAGVTQLSEAVDLLSLASLVVTNDSGLMHIAAALQRPLVAVYGSTSPDFTPPLSSQAKILKSSLSCSPCFKRHCPYGHHRCMKELTPRRLLELADNYNHFFLLKNL
ncbi:lipopolysaccharide heptosyltransferase II [Coxiella-like endosymbiont of Rhipicephalus sanguineus]|uniref:lipopolysaccharide heptosyltransferase II n=1 Tax=Coxiella-like endosymbiont of Rhipicephalus sanguineus TaxID=1955402 RepID=UPI00203F0C0F|nr:lipopolysaccharide heptosyltransferase II [Coxiella-like endosymbiont of Rhipicephalus sanguineus]MBT8506431.1 lipopolysaccharide heptosyltransferase II [Coxiella-like endosymbiont of Rhipicephalus sanguineus]